MGGGRVGDGRAVLSCFQNIARQCHWSCLTGSSTDSLRVVDICTRQTKELTWEQALLLCPLGNLL